ncbi:MAG TPA: 16S rRNA (guanine(527)-N(7))-methyltransferase RsmG, partial [Actinomycetota bacterium]
MNIPAEASARLAAYAELVRAWALRTDLIARGDLDRFEDRHIADSLRLGPLLAGVSRAVDVGSGGGLPGIPLAIAEPSVAWTLLEPRGKRAAFLDEVVRTLELRCEVVRATAQQAARDPRLGAGHDVAVARALAPPAEAFELLMPLVAAGGRAALLVGRDALLPPEAELWAEGVAIVEAPQ